MDAILNFIMWVAGLFGFGKAADPAADQRTADKQAGIDAAKAQAATAEVTEIQDAQKARQQSNTTNVDAGSDGVRERGLVDPDARPYNPSSLG